jgi:large subunit ribosomal protein L25
MQLPTEISIDVSELDIGDAIHVRDLDLDDEVEILDESDRIVATVSQPRIQLELEAEEAEAEGEEDLEEQPSEPEIISRR